MWTLLILALCSSLQPITEGGGQRPHSHPPIPVSCGDGYVRNKNGDCEPVKNCQNGNPPNQCGKDEQYYPDCAPSCTGTCRAYLTGGTYNCPLCRAGCWCKEGYVKDDNGKCIPKSECKKEPAQCGPGEEYKTCGTACPRKCDNLLQQKPCAEYCVKGCFCKEGMVRNERNECVNPEQCRTETCKKDEEYYPDCAPKCTGTCDAYNNKGEYHCPRCFPGCWCKKGLYKNSEGKCVPPSECGGTSVQCKANEEYKKCGTACPQTCDNLGQYVPCTDNCVEGCFCKQGYVKNENGDCVDPEECPHKECGEREIYDTCGSACPKTCENKDKNIFCSLQCVPGCFCEKGLVRGPDGKCIEPDRCPTSKNPTPTTYLPFTDFIPNRSGSVWHYRLKRKAPKQCRVDEVYEECGTACPRTCESLYTKIPCIEKCVPGCFCKGDLVRHNGKCIDIRKCPAQHNCPDNEVYNPCGDACPPTCPEVPRPQVCAITCISGCVCAGELVRNGRGDCVRPDQCPSKQCGPDEEYKICGTACPATCSTLGKPVPCPAHCVTGCFCKEGLVRDGNGKCVDPKKCPKERCGPREEYQECGTACPRTCRNLPYQIRCTNKCVKGCFCKEGFVRNDENECVDPKKCHSEECGENEEYTTCGSACPLTCDNKDKNIMCTLQCKIGCFCKKGYVQDKDGKCILPDQCPPSHSERPNCELAPDAGPCYANFPRFYYDAKSGKCKPFAYGGCLGNSNRFETEEDCYKKCGSTPTQSICDLPVLPGNCKGRKERYYYDRESGRCKRFTYTGCRGNKNNFRSAEECGKICGGRIRQCGRDEEYDDCGTLCPKTCRNLNVEIRCLDDCVKGCFCKRGLVRNDNNQCVKPEECPPIEQCGPNEEFSKCGSACPMTCANKDTPIMCTLQCQIGCFCKKGYVRDAEGKCIQPDQCPTNECTGLNEVVVDCAKPMWCNTCGIRGNCKLPECVKGCDCKPDYYRNTAMICVPKEQCRGFCPLNEEYSNCVNPCNSCEIRGRCNFLVCNKGCDCKKGYHRDGNNNCIPAAQCPPNNQCGDHELYNECGTACPRKCSNLNIKIACIDVCVPGCFCKDELVRNDEGKCVDPSQCPNGGECNGFNEVLVDCAKPKLCNTCTLRGNCSLKKCEKGCDCKPNYYRNATLDCIPEAKCPSKYREFLKAPRLNY